MTAQLSATTCRSHARQRWICRARISLRWVSTSVLIATKMTRANSSQLLPSISNASYSGYKFFLMNQHCRRLGSMSSASIWTTTVRCTVGHDTACAVANLDWSRRFSTARASVAHSRVVIRVPIPPGGRDPHRLDRQGGAVRVVRHATRGGHRDEIKEQIKWASLPWRTQSRVGRVPVCPIRPLMLTATRGYYGAGDREI